MYDVGDWRVLLLVAAARDIVTTQFPSVSETKCLRSFSYDLQANTVHSLTTSTLDDDQNECSTDNATTHSCVITPNGESAFTAAVFSINAFSDGTDSAGGRLSLCGRRERSEPFDLELTSSELTSQRAVNLTSLIGVPLESVTFTYTKGDDNLRFIMRLQGNVRLKYYVFSDDQEFYVCFATTDFDFLQQTVHCE